jgi:CBS domain-containing protein
LAIDQADIDRYLGVIGERVEAMRSGSQWLLDSLAAMKDRGTKVERLAALTGATHKRQISGEPVSHWELATLDESGHWSQHYRRVEQIMNTDLLTVREGEPVELVAHLMDWKRVHHVPVEDERHRLVGLVTQRSLLRLIGQISWRQSQVIPVGQIMIRNVVTVHPSASTLEAIALMKRHRITCLPVVDGDRLVGLISERDFMEMSRSLLEDALGDQA